MDLARLLQLVEVMFGIVMSPLEEVFEQLLWILRLGSLGMRLFVHT